VTIVAILIVAYAMVGGWPRLDAPLGNEVASGAIVAIELDTDDAGETTAVHLLYSFAAANGDRFFRRGTVGEDGILAGYGWEKLSNSEPIKVSYNPLDPEESIPFRNFPFWALASWASLVGTIAVSIALWIKIRLVPSPQAADESPTTPA
jgi:hypothetical protein